MAPFGNLRMTLKSFTPIGCDCMEWMPLERSYHLLCQLFTSFPLHLSAKQESALAVHQGKQTGPAQFAKNGIRFPITKPRTCIGGFQALANIILNLQLSPFILAVFAAPGFPLMPQLSFGSAIASRFALCRRVEYTTVDSLVNRAIANLIRGLLQLEPPCNLLRRPMLV